MSHRVLSVCWECHEKKVSGSKACLYFITDNTSRIIGLERFINENKTNL